MVSPASASTASPSVPERAAPAAILEVEHVTVEFPGVRALDDVHFDVRAARSTPWWGRTARASPRSSRCSAASTRPRAGGSAWPAPSYAPAHPSDAIAAGIAVIYQEFTLFPDLTVAENVYIGREPISAPHARHPLRPMRAGCRELFGMLGRGHRPGRARGRHRRGRPAARRDRQGALHGGPRHRHGRADGRAQQHGGHPPAGRRAPTCATRAAPSSTSATTSRRSSRWPTAPPCCATAATWPRCRSPGPPKASWCASWSVGTWPPWPTARHRSRARSCSD